jgi:hypothetical protein
MFAFLLMMAGYLVIRFVVMTAPVWATLAIVPNLQGTLRSALSVVAAAVVHPAVMAVGAPVSVLTTGYLLDPDTGLGRLGLLLSVLFTAMMWTVLKPYRRLTSLVTGNPVENTNRTLTRLRDQATGLTQAAGLDPTGLTTPATPAADATTTNPPPRPGIVAARFTRPDPSTILAWAREDDHTGPEWIPTTRARPDAHAVPTWARDHYENESRSEWVKISGLIRESSRRKANFGLGASTKSDAREAGETWVGEEFTLASDGKMLLSRDGLRQWRPPSFKPKLGKWQCNFEWRLKTQGPWQSNGHLDISEDFP